MILPQAVTHQAGNPRLVQVFYNSIAAAVNELDNITLSVADIVVGGIAAAEVVGVIHGSDVTARVLSRVTNSSTRF